MITKFQPVRTKYNLCSTAKYTKHGSNTLLCLVYFSAEQTLCFWPLTASTTSEVINDYANIIMQDIEIKFSVGCMVWLWCLGMPVQNWSDFTFTITGMALLATAAELVLLLILLVYIIPSPGKKPTEYIDSLEKNYHQRILFCLTLAEFLTWIILIPFEIKPSERCEDSLLCFSSF